jgi:hypothetical protein
VFEDSGISGGAVGCNLYLTSKASIPPHRPGERCSRCWACSANSNRALIQERVKAGIARARPEGKHLGRPRITVTRSPSAGVRATARECGVGASVVQRIKAG